MEDGRTTTPDFITAQSGEGQGEGEDIARLRNAFVAGQEPALVSTNQLAAAVEADTAFLCVAEAYSGGPGFSISKLVRQLVESASVPFLPFQRYKNTGLRKRADWEHVWELQRKEDAIDARVRPPSPRPSPLRGAREKPRASPENRERPAPSKRGIPFPLSRRERAGVRGNATD